ncbi:SOUL family heme-binding protein [Mycobacterium sp. Lab-001]|uniref:SOUL family heme-binding protein n=1 Tax=Mycobacterium sp. Lab-001 TaxID=3410136 RepID=UPI003D170995
MKLTELAEQVAESLVAVVGIRLGTEEPAYTRQELTDTVEIRNYGSRIAAQTTVPGDQERARNVGFRRLARYIFGGNRGGQAIAMTAPVGQHATAGQQIAMTAPVAQTGDDGRGWVIRFFMPSTWTMDTLPTPNDDQVRLVTVPPQTVAVLKFSGDRSPQAVADRIAELRNVLRNNDIVPIGGADAWFYDPPWTLPCRRRNEVAIPVES